MIKIDFSSLNTVACPMCGGEGFRLEAVRFDSGRITKCDRCGHLYLNPPIPGRILDDVYKESYGHPEEQFRQELEAWFQDPSGPYQVALSYFKENGYSLDGKRLFEIGAGAGRFLHECRRRGAIVQGLDFFPSAVSIAKKYYDLDLVCCSIEQAQVIADASYDLVFSFEVIEHVYKPQELIKLAHRILKKGGLFLLSTPNFEIFKKMHDNRYAAAPAQEHLHYFTLQTLGQCFKDDFDIVRLTTANPVLFGDRQKSICINNKLVWGAWLAVRKFSLVFKLKEKLFPALNKIKKEDHLGSLNGLELFVIARKR